MKIEFYEEFPSKETLRKLKLLDFPTKVFIAAKSLEEFQKYENLAKSYKKDVEVAYWPIVKNSYWISLFSNTKDLKDLFEDLDKIDNDILIDLELPLAKSFRLYFKNILSTGKNRRLIKNFMQRNKERIMTAEHPLAFVSKIMSLVGMNFDVSCERSIMWYSSKRSKKTNQKIRKELKNKKGQKMTSVSVGTIASGVVGDEVIMPPEDLERDLSFVKECGFQKAIIFRLGGLNKDYLEAVKKFTH